MGKDRTNTKSHRGMVGHLEIGDRAAIVAQCRSLGLRSEFRLFIERLCWESCRRWRKEGGATKESKKERKSSTGKDRL